MTLAYLPRLVCIVMACLCLVSLATAALIALSSGPAIRAARGLAPREAARFVLALRLMPFGLGVCAVALCVPSYLWFEPERVEERVGLVCLSMALLGAVMCAIAAARAVRAAVRPMLFLRRCRQSGRESGELVVIESARPFLALTGIVRPRVVISQSIVDALPEDELSVVLSHERAHRTSADNLKRLGISLLPGFRALERAWIRFAEYAADEQAVAGDERRALALASALVRVARFSAIAPLSPLGISFLGDAGDLAERVDRLLSPRKSFEAPRRGTGPPVILAGCLAAMTFNPATLRTVQWMLERLIR